MGARNTYDSQWHQNGFLAQVQDGEFAMAPVNNYMEVPVQAIVCSRAELEIPSLRICGIYGFTQGYSL